MWDMSFCTQWVEAEGEGQLRSRQAKSIHEALGNVVMTAPKASMEGTAFFFWQHERRQEDLRQLPLAAKGDR